MRYLAMLVLMFLMGCTGSEGASGGFGGRGRVSPPVVVAPRYYVSLYCYESVPNRAAYSHNFAVFVKVYGEKVDKVGISWMPASSGRLLARQPGRNWSVEETQAYAVAQGRVLEELGPYECKAELWERAVAMERALASGSVDYAGLGSGTACCNCIHAVLNVVQPEVKTGTLWGKRANAFILRYYRPYLIEPGRVHSSVPRL